MDETRAAAANPWEWRWMLALSFVVPMVVYVLTAAPGTYWLDTSELTAAIFLGGNPHPPGHPLYVALGQLAMLLPIGSIALRANLLSAVFGALSCTVLAVAARSILLVLEVPPRRAGVMALVGALLAGSSYALWFQSVRAEVYTLHLMVASLLVALAVELGCRVARGGTADARLLYFMALIGGLGLANHHYLTGFVLVPVGLFLLANRETRALFRPANVVRIVALGLVGLSTYVWLPLRALSNPLVNWGDPDNAGDFVWVVTARVFQQALDDSQTRPSAIEALVDALGVSAQQVTPVGLVVALAGLFALWRWRLRGLAVLLAAVVALNLTTQGLFKTFDPTNPDVHGYFALTAWVVALGVVVAVGAFDRLAHSAVDREGRSNPRVAGVVSILAVASVGALVVINGALTLPDARLDGFGAVEVVADAALDDLPRGSLLFTSDFQTCFTLWYAQGVEQMRPDVTVVHRSWLNEPSYVRPMTERYPEALALAANPGNSYHLDLAALLAESRKRPVFVEYHDSVRPDLLPHLAPQGLFFRVVPDPVPPGGLPESLRKRNEAFWDGLRQRLGASQRPMDRETKAVLLWRHYLLAKAHLARGDRALAAFHVSRALALNPESPEVKLLELQLGAGG